MTVTAYSVYRNEAHKLEAYPLEDYTFYYMLSCETSLGEMKMTNCLKLNQEQFDKLCELIDEFRALNLVCTQNKTAKEE